MMTGPPEKDVREALRLKAMDMPEEAAERLRSTDYKPKTGRGRFACCGTGTPRSLRRLRLPGR